MLNVMTFGLGGLGEVSLGYDVGMSIFQNDPQGAAQEIGFEVAGYAFESNGLKFGQYGVSAVDIWLDIKGLSEAEQAWIPKAIENVNVNIAQAQAELLSIWLSTPGPMSVSPSLPGPLNSTPMPNTWIPTPPIPWMN